jgi:hypothetical protein
MWRGQGRGAVIRWEGEWSSEILGHFHFKLQLNYLLAGSARIIWHVLQAPIWNMHKSLHFTLIFFPENWNLFPIKFGEKSWFEKFGQTGLALNSFFGKCGQRTNMKKSKFVTDLASIINVFSDPSKTIVDYHILSFWHETICCVLCMKEHLPTSWLVALIVPSLCVVFEWILNLCQETKVLHTSESRFCGNIVSHYEYDFTG